MKAIRTRIADAASKDGHPSLLETFPRNTGISGKDVSNRFKAGIRLKSSNGIKASRITRAFSATRRPRL
jgi:hypothetical protein